MAYKTRTGSSKRFRILNRFNTLTVFPNKVSPIGSPSFLCCMAIAISFCTDDFFFRKLNNIQCKYFDIKVHIVYTYTKQTEIRAQKGEWRDEKKMQRLV
jgi:hypothetical protein